MNKLSINTETNQVTDGMDPNVLQRHASDPQSCVWVNASAGTGKTKILTDRILRLLLPDKTLSSGVAPHKILALTFTKAAANEMVLRITETLADWAISDEEDLKSDLVNLLGYTPDSSFIDAARGLFAKVSQASRGLQIMTIHAFCQSVLGRFALEARVPPNFTTLDENEAQELLYQAFLTVLGSKNPEIIQSISILGEVCSIEQLRELLAAILSERYQFQSLLRTHFSVEGIYTQLCADLKITPHLEVSKIIHDHISNLDFYNLEKAAMIMVERGKKTDIEKGLEILKWLKLDIKSKVLHFSDYISVFFKNNGESYKNLITKDLCTNYPFILDLFEGDIALLSKIQITIKGIKCASFTRALLIFSEEILKKYETIKEARNVLDYEDLIIKTLALLQAQDGKNAQSGWVMYKLDQGFDHILVDEAQDTNPDQWRIIESICTEFFAGNAAQEDVNRTVFVVGDEKQSIYGFQRASPQEFFRMRGLIEKQVRQSQKKWSDVQLYTSFRSVKSVLDTVNAVFVNNGYPDIKHTSYRRGQAGLVEIWPLCEEKEKPDKKEHGLFLAGSIRQYESSQTELCKKIALTIRNWIDNKKRLPSRGEPITPGDIMILVKSRDAFVTQLARTLKNNNIPFSGMDRFSLTSDISVQDMILLAKFGLLQEDDLTLGCILKSPFIGTSEEELFDLAYDRGEESLWERVQKKASKEITMYLKDIISKARSLSPYDFFHWVLYQPCPANGISGMKAMQARLGRDCQDPLEELLNESLGYSMRLAKPLQNFIEDFIKSEKTIKREVNDNSNTVRIMTVHGAKGLQAPIVIMPDTIRYSRAIPGKTDTKLLWPDKTILNVPLWTPFKDLAHPLYEEALENIYADYDAEYNRLLYVAMTRAEDRLYVCGYTKDKKPRDDSWYFKVEEGLRSLEDIKILDDGTLRLRNDQTKPLKEKREGQDNNKNGKKIDIPSFLFEKAPQEYPNRKPYLPSRLSNTEPPAFSPLADDSGYRFLRGNITHGLLEFLPDLPEEKWEQAAAFYLKKNGQDLDETIKNDVIREVFVVLKNPAYKDLFGNASQAEVSVTGVLDNGRVLSGKIDRVYIDETVVKIIDFKTNRNPPVNTAEIPDAYIKQMRAYADALRAIYPDKEISASLLWTDGCVLMPVDLES